MGAHGGEPARRPGGFAIRLQKNVPTYLGFADLQSAASKNAVAGLGLTSPPPSSFFGKRRNLYIFGFLGSRGRS